MSKGEAMPYEDALRIAMDIYVHLLSRIINVKIVVHVGVIR